MMAIDARSHVSGFAACPGMLLVGHDAACECPIRETDSTGRRLGLRMVPARESRGPRVWSLESAWRRRRRTAKSQRPVRDLLAGTRHTESNGGR